jgi:hypothetical protein
MNNNEEQETPKIDLEGLEESEICKIKFHQIDSPESHGNALNSYLRFKLTFEMEGNNFEVWRRYSDFDMLRKLLRKCVPFHYIHPLPPKKAISIKQTNVLNDRLEELNHFVKFLIDNHKIFDCDGFWKFFDANLCDTKIGSILAKVSNVSYDYTFIKFQQLYPEYLKSEEFDFSLAQKIREFKEKIEVNIEFYHKFLSLVREYINKMANHPMNQEKKVFFEMLVINYSNRQESFEELQKNYKDILEKDELEYWKFLERKIKMLENELACFLQIETDFTELVETYLKEKTNKALLVKKIDTLEKTGSEKVGLFKKVSKDDKMGEYQDKLKTSNERLDLYNKLLHITSSVIINREIPIIKKCKKIRFKETIDVFSRDKIDLYGTKINFWESVLKQNEHILNEMEDDKNQEAQPINPDNQINENDQPEIPQ